MLGYRARVYGSLWRFKDICGCVLRMFMDLYGSLWIFMDLHGCLWMFMDDISISISTLLLFFFLNQQTCGAPALWTWHHAEVRWASGDAHVVG